MCKFTIGQLSKATDVPVSTIRYYERRGLLHPDARSSGNYRLFGQEAYERLLFVRSAQAAGFTLKNIALLLEYRDEGAAPCREVQGLIADRLKQVSETIRNLREVESMLSEWMNICREAENSGRCGVLEGLRGDCRKNCKNIEKQS